MEGWKDDWLVPIYFIKYIIFIKKQYVKYIYFQHTKNESNSIFSFNFFPLINDRFGANDAPPNSIFSFHFLPPIGVAFGANDIPENPIFSFNYYYYLGWF